MDRRLLDKLEQLAWDWDTAIKIAGANGEDETRVHLSLRSRDWHEILQMVDRERQKWTSD